MGPLDRPSFAAKLKSLRARGKIPLALSLTQAMSDLEGTSAADPVTLVLLTDGGEDTMPRRDPVKVAAQLSKHPGITFHIVGFDINQEDWGRRWPRSPAGTTGPPS
jgi:Mg-chelatase subunit ChlD